MWLYHAGYTWITNHKDRSTDRADKQTGKQNRKQANNETSNHANKHTGSDKHKNYMFKTPGWKSF